MAEMPESNRIKNVVVAQAALLWMAFNRRIAEYLSGPWCPANEPHYAESRVVFREVLENAIRALSHAVGEFDGIPRLPSDGDTGPNDAGECRTGKSGFGPYEALLEARRRWGESGFVRWRRTEVQEILGREAKSDRLFQVGRFVELDTGEHIFSCYGEGSSWEEALADAAEVERDPAPGA
jgi:hypothetical protein